jgi:hypothetical protein
MEVQLHAFLTSTLMATLSPSLPGKEHLYPLNRMLGGPQSRSERGGEQKIYLLLPGTQFSIYIYICMCVCVYIYVYIYIKEK